MFAPSKKETEIKMDSSQFTGLIKSLQNGSTTAIINRSTLNQMSPMQQGSLMKVVISKKGKVID
ncbi:MAG: hypothetical protein QM504_17425 [Pseudomonadota bacterium]